MNSDKLNELSKNINSPVPFWFLNGPMSEWHVIREFEMMKEKGVDEVIVHPRYGIDVGYLTEDWWRLFGWCLREAKRLGMHIWIYDELNWPSGTAGMTIQNENPDFRSKHLIVEATPVAEIDPNSLKPGFYVVAANMEGGRVTKTRLIDDIAGIKSLGANWVIFNCTLGYDPFYIDTLSFDAVNRFKEVTYDEYYNRFGDEFGKTIRAVFTDEPSVYWVSVGMDNWNIPYTTDFFTTFEKRFGYEPASMLPYLFYEGRESASFRADYWDHAGHLFNERYHGNLGGWCREHGIIYTGHNNNEEPLRYQIRYQGNMFDTMRLEDIPGVDHLTKQTLGNWFISIIGHKICSSAAHIGGKARCMSESFGVMDWDTTFTNLKRVTDWQYALGINLMIPHAIFHTISGCCKRESPPSFFYQSPHWDDFDYFTNYLRNLEKMLCGGKHVCKVGVMYPFSGLWSTYQPDRKTPDFEHVDNFINSLCLELIKNQIDFDLLDYRALSEAELAEGRINLADESYEFLIVPATPYLRPEEVKRLTEIVGSGVNTTLFFKSMEPLQENMPDGLRDAAFVRSSELESLVDVLKKQADHNIQITGGGAEDIMAYRREINGKKITFLLNRSEKHRKVTAMLKNYPNAAIFDQENGTYTRLDGRSAGAKLQTELRFQPNQSYFIVSDVDDAMEEKVFQSEPKPIELNNLRVDVPYNTASIFHFVYSAEGKEPAEVDVRDRPKFIAANWDANTQDFTRFAGTYEAEFEICREPNGIDLIADGDFAKCEVYINDKLVELKPCCTGPESCDYLTDFGDLCATMDAYLVRGTNRIRVISPDKLSEPLRLKGDFFVRLAGTQVIIEEKGSSDTLNLENNYPFYSGTITYTADFKLDNVPHALMLDMHDVKDAAEVFVNSKPAGKRLWAPYTLDIADASQSGDNTLEIRVRNNMVNVLQGNPRNLGLRKMPSLAAFD